MEQHKKGYNKMFKSFDKYLVDYSKEYKRPFVRVSEDLWYPFMILPEDQKIKNIKEYVQLMDQIQSNKDYIFCCDFVNEEVYLTKKEYVTETIEDYSISYIMFDMNSGEEILEHDLLLALGI